MESANIVPKHINICAICNIHICAINASRMCAHLSKCEATPLHDKEMMIKGRPLIPQQQLQKQQHPYNYCYQMLQLRSFMINTVTVLKNNRLFLRTSVIIVHCSFQNTNTIFMTNYRDYRFLFRYI